MCRASLLRIAGRLIREKQVRQHSIPGSPMRIAERLIRENHQMTLMLRQLAMFRQTLTPMQMFHRHLTLTILIPIISGDSDTRATRAEPELQNDAEATRAEPKLRNDGRLVII